MAKPIATYSFLPYLRIGLPNKIEQPDQDPSIKLRATFGLELTLESQAVGGAAAPPPESIPKQVQLYGPGDIIGVEQRAFFKTEPRDWITNFESNYFPYIDFYDEDFPWRYTPSKHDQSLHRLPPWIALVALEEGEFKDGTNIKNKPLAFIQVDNADDKFPPPDQLWAWVHVHVNSDLGANDAEIVSTNMDAVLPKLDAALKSNADLAYSRLLCPRKLKPNAAYHCFLVPAYEAGRQAGLGLDINPTFASQYAWGTGQTEFPYFHRWYFRTGTLGDFEYLVRLLQPKPADERVGRRDMDVQRPGWNVPKIDPDGPLAGILKLGGALRVPKEVIKNIDEYNKYENWADTSPPGYPQLIEQGIANFVNLADDYQKAGPNPQPIPDPDNPPDPDPLITPPLYGRWHAAVDRLLTRADGTPLPNDRNWIHELNLDPRFRVAGGFGTRVIQKNQEEYMNIAWQQVGDVLKANHLIRLAQLTNEVLWQWHTKIFQPLVAAQPDKVMLFSAPLQKRVLLQNTTLFYQLKTSLVPPVAVSPQMRRIMRPRARTVRMLPFVERNIAPGKLVTRLNTGEVVPAPPKITPPAIFTEDVLADQVQPPPQPKWLADLLRDYPWLPWATLGLAVLILILLFLIAPAFPLAVLGGAIVLGLGVLFFRMLAIARALAQPQIFQPSGQTPAAVDQAPMSSDFRITEPEETFRPSTGTSDNVEAVRFKTALRDMYTVDVAATSAAFTPPKQALKIDDVATEVVATLHPDRTIPLLLLDRIVLPGRIRFPFTPERFDQIMNYPQFDLPMYKPLSDLSKEYFLPNINLIEQNSITLLETNQKFIESYMVGINHEMSRELLWREYPTDQRGSYFRQFWDVSGYLPDASEDLTTLKERLKDIPEIHRWVLTSNLGDHDNRATNGQKADLVLVIRGELLKKYPTAVIYAHKAKWPIKDGKIDLTQQRDLADIPDGQEDKPPRTIVKTPLYSAKVDPDIYFFGFDLSSDEAKGSDGTHPGDENKPGWFFVIKERPGEPRFGLDIGGPNAVKNLWSDLAWEDAAPGLADGGFLQITNTTAAIPLTEPVNTGQAEFDEEHQQWSEDNQIAWRKEMDSADLAYVLYQVPVLVAVHASEMLTLK
jgi:hypothetical protein